MRIPLRSRTCSIIGDQAFQTLHSGSVAVEPLGVALQLARGEEPLVAKEVVAVVEVAKDIVERHLRKLSERAAPAGSS